MACQARKGTWNVPMTGFDGMVMVGVIA